MGKMERKPLGSPESAKAAGSIYAYATGEGFMENASLEWKRV